MKKNLLILTMFFFSGSLQLLAQNYLRVTNPQYWWGVEGSQTPGWENYHPHGQFDEITITAAPKGIFTEIEVYATISGGPDADFWNNLEIIWQFELPSNAIVHDAWLWVNQDIIKADIIDYWTALETYTGFVDYNQDPLFFYRLPDNRYEVRVFPLTAAEGRRIKLSFLIPGQWEKETIKQNILQHMFQSTDYMADEVRIAVPVNETWGTPALLTGNDIVPMTETITGGTGDLLHYIDVPGTIFTDNAPLLLSFDAPYNDNQAFAGVYSSAGNHYYQVVYAPNWQSLLPSSTEKLLLLLDYDENRTSMSKSIFAEYLTGVLSQYLSENQEINIAVATPAGVQFLNNDWWQVNLSSLQNNIVAMLDMSVTYSLADLLQQGFEWASAQNDVSKIYIIAANDDYVFPPYADAVFFDIESSIPTNIPVTLMDYQDENVSLLYYNNQSYIGNSYFYQLLQDHISSYEQYTLYNNNNGVEAILAQIFPYNGLGDGTLACQVTFPEGLAYTTYDLYNPDFVAGDNGVVVQTGKYVGNFPMQITASHISADGTLLISSTSIPLEQTYQGDTLIQKIWYGPHLRQKESQIASTADRLWLIENSIEQRILTGSTAFLALEPGAGGEPCIDCLNNNGGLIIQVAETDTSSMHTQWTATPNPAVARASLVFTYHGHYIQDEWQVEIMDMSGKVISVLSAPQVSSGKLIWNWEIGSEVADGMYVAKLTQPAGIWNTKILVQKY